MKTLFTLGMVFVFLLSVPSFAKAETYWLRGGLIGAGTGAALGLGFYGIVDAKSDWVTGSKNIAMYGALGGAGAVVGFGIGALIGHQFEKKKQTAFFVPHFNPLEGIYGYGMRIDF